MQSFWQDLHYSARTLVRRPGFSAVAIITLALGIGACTAIFSIVDAVLFRPLPYPEAEKLINIREVDAKGRQTTFAEPNFFDVHARTRTLAAAAEYNIGLTTVVGGTEPVRTNVAYVSRDFFKVLGVQPVTGRGWLSEETKIGGSPTVIVSHGFWERVLGSRNDLASTALRIGEHSFAVVGVMPERFDFPKSAEVWLPFELYPPQASRRSHGRRVIARLRDDVTLAQARAELSTIGKQLKQENGTNIDLVDITARPLKEALVGDVSQSLLLIMAAVGLLLLVACTNVGNLLLAQATARQREFAVRTALGATRWRLARQFIAENLMLALAADGIGAVLSFWGVAALVALNQGNLPRADEISVNARVMVFSFGLSALVAVVLALVPLIRFGGRGLQAGLKESARGQSANASSHRFRALLVISQVALTLVLLVGAGLLIKSFVKVLRVDPGFHTESAVVMEISLNNEPMQMPFNNDSARRRARFYEETLEKLAALPGVVAVGGVNGLPILGGGNDGEFLIDNDPSRKGYGEFRVASPGYFKAMGMHLVRGRLFDQSDGPETAQVALINESLARQYWPNEDPLDKGIQYGSMDGDKHLLRVVGVVNDVRENGLEENSPPTVYVHYLQRPGQANGFAIVARTQGNVENLIPAMRGVVQSLNREAATNFRTLEQISSSSLDNRRFSLMIFGCFAGVALLLAALGIYSVTSYVVTQRTQEIGIRMALGARTGNVLGLVLRQGMGMVLIGIGTGLVAAFVLARLMASLLFHVSPTDLPTLVTISLFMAAVALLACYIPARRATKLDPLVALRTE